MSRKAIANALAKQAWREKEEKTLNFKVNFEVNFKGFERTQKTTFQYVSDYFWKSFEVFLRVSEATSGTPKGAPIPEQRTAREISRSRGPAHPGPRSVCPSCRRHPSSKGYLKA